MENKFAFCVWVNGSVREMADFYARVFEKSKETRVNYFLDDLHGKKGDILTIALELDNAEFLLLNGGPEFSATPAVSYVVECPTEAQLHHLWSAFSEKGQILMPLENHPETGLFGWVTDEFGVSWQLKVSDVPKQKITPCFLFANELYRKADDAINEWIEIFSHGTVINKVQNEDGSIAWAKFKLYDQEFYIMDNEIPHDFGFTMGNSFYVYCDGQPEIDRFFYALTEDGKAYPCGWVNDRFGVSWQLVTKDLDELLDGKNEEKSYQTMQALYEMTKIDIQKLRNVYMDA
jgi:predicted 3-demethylubiquinone-9 3-methyltransferase (glyoxalase superfamily)